MMFKTLFFILAWSIVQVGDAKVDARWLTVASVLLDDGKTKILFDAAWTRPEIGHWLNLKTLKSDEDLVKSVLSSNGLSKIDAAFTSHSHFDHVLDLPMVSKLSAAVFYVDESSERIANAYGEPAIRTIRMFRDRPIRVGDFVITPIKRAHSKILQLVDFLPGPVPEKTNLSFWDYHVGDTWIYLIDHPEGTILLDQGPDAYVDEVKKHTTKVDALIQGVANRRSDEVVIEGYARTFSPKIFMPVHFDNFFFSFRGGEYSDLPGVNLERVLGKLKKAYPTLRADRPSYGKPVTLLEIKR